MQVSVDDHLRRGSMNPTAPVSIRVELFRVIVVAAFLFLGGVSNTYPRGIPWHEAGGPYGGPVNTLTTFDGALYAGTSGNGVFFSTNQGVSWTAASAGLTNPYVIALAGSGTMLLAGTTTGVFLSTDFGTSWTADNSGLTNTYVEALAISSGGGGLKLFAGTNGGAFLSVDTARSWTRIKGTSPDTLQSNLIYSLVTDTSGHVFAGTYGNGLFRSTDDGTHWTQLGGFPGSYVYSFAVKGDTLVASGRSIFNTIGVYVSTNGGDNWSPYHTGWQYTIPYALAFLDTGLYAGSDRGVYLAGDANPAWTQVNFGLAGDTLIHALAAMYGDLFAAAGIGGVYVSANNASWTQVNTGLYTHVQALTLFGPHVYAGTAEAGLFFSIYGGTSWIQENSGLTNANVTSLASAYNNVYAGTISGVFWGLNGKNWVPAGTGLLSSKIQALVAGPAAGTPGNAYLYAGSNSGVFRSTNYGSTWDTVQHSYVRSLAVRDSTVFAGTAGNGVFLSTNSGTSWTPTAMTTGNVQALAMVGSNLFAAIDNNVVERTSDNGASWVQVYGNAADPVTTFAVAGSVLLAGTGGGHVLFTVDDGTNWPQSGSALPAVPVSALAVAGGDIYAGTYNASVWTMSLAGIGPVAASVTLPVAGPTLTPRPARVLQDTLYDFNLPGNATDVRIDFTSIVGFGSVTVERYQSGPTNPTFAGTPPANISAYRWNVIQSGLTSLTAEIRFDLTRFSSGIPHPGTVTIYSRPTPGSGTFNALPTTFDSASNQLRAMVSSFSEFIFGSDDNLFTEVRLQNNLQEHFHLDQNYPNPFNPRTRFSYGLPDRSRVVIQICNVLGQIVATLVDAVQEPGYHSVEWMAGDGVSSGMYFYRLTAASTVEPGRAFVQVRKMVLTK